MYVFPDRTKSRRVASYVGYGLESVRPRQDRPGLFKFSQIKSECYCYVSVHMIFFYKINAETYPINRFCCGFFLLNTVFFNIVEASWLKISEIYLYNYIFGESLPLRCANRF